MKFKFGLMLLILAGMISQADTSFSISSGRGHHYAPPPPNVVVLPPAPGPQFAPPPPPPRGGFGPGPWHGPRDFAPPPHGPHGHHHRHFH